ncbi:hypothetical protein CCR85_05055 [Rhodothalassium salexigens]|uniref:hypothetical protein n=1 Tax=Rhodothalassium salexigens TaxID=1086 RepID=UPI001911A3CF|nr:hypothetical protein [Rhodothalassium salexigens]MBK5910860.1 hypothetical protein [Rhodothalassium salexigens]MBK5920148.1 hypothetical protein [Rhodothalassium salexigens]
MSVNRADYHAFLKQVEVALETALEDQPPAQAPYRDQLEAMHDEVVRTRAALCDKHRTASRVARGNGLAAD